MSPSQTTSICHHLLFPIGLDVVRTAARRQVSFVYVWRWTTSLFDLQRSVEDQHRDEGVIGDRRTSSSPSEWKSTVSIDDAKQCPSIDLSRSTDVVRTAVLLLFERQRQITSMLNTHLCCRLSFLEKKRKETVRGFYFVQIDRLTGVLLAHEFAWITFCDRFLFAGQRRDRFGIQSDQLTEPSHQVDRPVEDDLFVRGTRQVSRTRRESLCRSVRWPVHSLAQTNGENEQTENVECRLHDVLSMEVFERMVRLQCQLLSFIPLVFTLSYWCTGVVPRSIRRVVIH